VKDIVDEVSRTYSIDEYKIYALGWNNGGAFALNVGLRYSQVFAAVCNVMGGYLFQNIINVFSLSLSLSLSRIYKM
jgi:predicted peptidase